MNRIPRSPPAPSSSPALLEITPDDYAAGLKVELERTSDDLAKARGAVFALRRRIVELEAVVREDGAKLAALAGRLGDELEPGDLAELAELAAGNAAAARRDDEEREEAT